MDCNKNDLVRIAVENVQVGMFVTAIEKSKLINLTTAGRVSSQKGIQQLSESGIRFVWVDTKRSTENCTFTPAPERETAPDHEEQELSLRDRFRANKPKDILVRREKARKLISEAKDLVSKILHDTFGGQSIHIGDVEDWADNVTDIILVDSDAVNYVSALRTKDAYLLEHSVNVACLLVTFGNYLQFDKDKLKQLAIGGILHDVGKTKVKSKVLNKPGKLTDEEFEHMKCHQVYGAELVNDVDGLSDISKSVCVMHHEKLDGQGYPKGLGADEIPIYGRMSSIVDIYDALTAERCYKSSMPPSEAFKILLSMTPHQLDQDLVYKFINCISVYPVGSLVQLNDGSVGIVEEANQEQPLKPKVKCFYSNKYKRFIEIKAVDLAHSNLKVESAVAPSSLGVDISPFYT